MPKTFHDLNPSPRILLGPGPSMVHPRVLRSMATPVIGYMDPDFLAIMADVKDLLQQTFQTENDLTLAVPGTGTSAMEAAISNLVEPGDKVLACVQGYFGERLAEMAERHGADVTRLSRDWGDVFEPQAIESAVSEGEYKLVTLVHAETSTGALQPGIPAIARACHQAGALLVLDCVTSLGGVALEVDAWDVDVAYSAGQKCLSGVPGLSPITLSARAVKTLGDRSTPPSVFYLDLNLLDRYWGSSPAYHHTAPTSTMYALREALRMVQEEGLEARLARHMENAKRLWNGLEALGLTLWVEDESLRIPSLTTCRVPEGFDEAKLRAQLRDEFNVEIAGGFGPLAGKIWRIGLMGESSRHEYVTLLLGALRELLTD
ncbi:MAG: alanine--glyoxylate aminotransferase family protein [Anaerolineales bacterium]|jgi:alanine-glyoxylate transaminase/serine-glyoxylate transaminase/serine-pyruvate transaminase